VRDRALDQVAGNHQQANRARQQLVLARAQRRRPSAFLAKLRVDETP
jgi:hypothetical protein